MVFWLTGSGRITVLWAGFQQLLDIFKLFEEIKRKYGFDFTSSQDDHEKKRFIFINVWRHFMYAIWKSAAPPPSCATKFNVKIIIQFILL